MADRIFGEIPDNPPGTTYASRREAWAAGVHRETMAGICGDETGSESIVVSGGYVDDVDDGDVIIYTGHGGRDPDSGKQIADQELTKKNLGLARSHLDGLPVRVIRGYEGNPAYSPAAGYRYDGLYQVTDYWHEPGRDAYEIWRFRLVKAGASETADVQAGDPAHRVETTVQRIVRSTEIANRVKDLHDHTCQICGIQLLTPAGAYAEAAHVRGLGAPHHGPDSLDNVLCLCPNHHVLFDNGAIYIDEEEMVREAGSRKVIAQLRLVQGHTINQQYVRYHRDHYMSDS
jgi:putative restriction endonuclease